MWVGARHGPGMITFMNTTPDDQTELRVFLRAARPDPTLPPGFHNAVWSRIDHGRRSGIGRDANVRSLETLLCWLLHPVRAGLGAVALLLVGVSIGILQGNQVAHDLARDRYIASVSPIVSR